MAKDLYHDAVKIALEKEGWTITEDPFTMNISVSLSYHIDLAAEKFIIAKRETRVIVVEVKSFLNASTAYDFHSALGQYCVYKSALKYLNKNEKLLMAVPNEVYTTFFQQPFIQQVLKDYQCEVISYDPFKKQIIYANF